jgi:hypothetical protein
LLYLDAQRLASAACRTTESGTMDAAKSEQRHEPQVTTGVRRVGCKHSLGREIARIALSTSRIRNVPLVPPTKYH